MHTKSKIFRERSLKNIETTSDNDDCELMERMFYSYAQCPESKLVHETRLRQSLTEVNNVQQMLQLQEDANEYKILKNRKSDKSTFVLPNEFPEKNRKQHKTGLIARKTTAKTNTKQSGQTVENVEQNQFERAKKKSVTYIKSDTSTADCIASTVNEHTIVQNESQVGEALGINEVLSQTHLGVSASVASSTNNGIQTSNVAFIKQEKWKRTCKNNNQECVKRRRKLPILQHSDKTTVPYNRSQDMHICEQHKTTSYALISSKDTVEEKKEINTSTLFNHAAFECKKKKVPLKQVSKKKGRKKKHCMPIVSLRTSNDGNGANYTHNQENITSKDLFSTSDDFPMISSNEQADNLTYLCFPELYPRNAGTIFKNTAPHACSSQTPNLHSNEFNIATTGNKMNCSILCDNRGRTICDSSHFCKAKEKKKDAITNKITTVSEISDKKKYDANDLKYMREPQVPIRMKINLLEQKVVYATCDSQIPGLNDKVKTDNEMKEENNKEFKITNTNKIRNQFFNSSSYNNYSYDKPIVEPAREEFFQSQLEGNNAGTKTKGNIPNNEDWQSSVNSSYVDASSNKFHDESNKCMVINIVCNNNMNICDMNEREVHEQQQRLTNDRNFTETGELMKRNSTNTINENCANMDENHEKKVLSQKNCYYSTTINYEDYHMRDIQETCDNKVECYSYIKQQERHAVIDEAVSENVINEEFISQSFNADICSQMVNENNGFKNSLYLSCDMKENYKPSTKYERKISNNNQLTLEENVSKKCCEIGVDLELGSHKDTEESNINCISLCNDTYNNFVNKFVEESSVNRKSFIEKSYVESETGREKEDNGKARGDSSVSKLNVSSQHLVSYEKNNDKMDSHTNTVPSIDKVNKNFKNFFDNSGDSMPSYVLKTTDISDNSILTFNDVLNLSTEAECSSSQTEEDNDVTSSVKSTIHNENVLCKKIDESRSSLCFQDDTSADNENLSDSEKGCVKKDGNVWSEISVAMLLEESNAMKTAVMDLECISNTVQELKQIIESKNCQIQSLTTRLEEFESNPLIKILEHVICESGRNNSDNMTPASAIVKILYSYAKENNIKINNVSVD